MAQKSWPSGAPARAAAACIADTPGATTISTRRAPSGRPIRRRGIRRQASPARRCRRRRRRRARRCGLRRQAPAPSGRAPPPRRARIRIARRARSAARRDRDRANSRRPRRSSSSSRFASGVSHSALPGPMPTIASFPRARPTFAASMIAGASAMAQVTRALFRLGDDERRVRPGGGERRRLGDAVRADLAEHGLGGILEPRRLGFERRGGEEARRHAETAPRPQAPPARRPSGRSRRRARPSPRKPGLGQRALDQRRSLPRDRRCARSRCRPRAGADDRSSESALSPRPGCFRVACRSCRSRENPTSVGGGWPSASAEGRVRGTGTTSSRPAAPRRRGEGNAALRKPRRVALEPRRRAGEQRRHHAFRVFRVGERPAFRRRVERDAEAVVAGGGDRGVAAERGGEFCARDRWRRDARRAAARSTRRPPTRRSPAARRACRKAAARACGSGFRRRRCRRWAGLRRERAARRCGGEIASAIAHFSAQARAAARSAVAQCRRVGSARRRPASSRAAFETRIMEKYGASSASSSASGTTRSSPRVACAT